MLLVYFVIFIFGLAVGSFLNVVIFRLESGEKIINDRSKCLYCKHILVWHDLIPIFSFLFLKGRCRYCKHFISIQYPLVELVTGVLFVLIFNFQFSIFNEFSIFNFQTLINFYFLLSTFCFLFIVSALIVIFVYDLKHYIIPDEIVYFSIVLMIAFNALNDIFGDNLVQDFAIFSSQFLNNLFAAIVIGGFFFLIVALTRGKGMGGGDVKLGFLMGLILGWPLSLLALFFSFITGAIVGAFLILVGKKKMKSMVPFGPFLVLGTFVAMFWGERIIEWYVNLINLRIIY